MVISTKYLHGLDCYHNHNHHDSDANEHDESISIVISRDEFETAISAFIDTFEETGEKHNTY